MATANLNHAASGLSQEQVGALAKKMENFYQNLSPQERVHVNLALSRMADNTSDVAGHASLAEYATLLSVLLMLL